MTTEIAVITGLVSAFIAYVCSKQIQKKSEVGLLEEINNANNKWKNAEDQISKNLLAHTYDISQLRAENSSMTEDINKKWQDQFDAKCSELNIEKSDNAKRLEEISTYWQDKLENKVRELNTVREEEVRSFYERGRADELRSIDERSKAFTVEVRPYIKVEETTEYMGLKKRKAVHIGYQYQLFVTTVGVPAGFPPCIITHENYIHEEIDKELFDKYKDSALQAAKLAVDGYTMGATSLFKFIKEPKIDGSIDIKESKKEKK
ncbi:MAG: hypothetical protein JJE30_08570 [Desulfuromonadales bacterium]|nr:hypothetical protein [Desulfuromonadales bacterium]